METIRSSRSVGAFVGALGLAIIAAACTEDVGPTVDDVRVFLAGDSIREGAEPRLLRLWVDAGRAAWVQNNFITDDTNAIASAANTAVMAATTELAAEAAQFNDLDLPADLERKMTLLRTSLSAGKQGRPDAK